mgnify:CR=1 FL=1
MGSSSTPYHETFKALYNSDADVRLASGELFEELKSICLWSLYVDRDNEGFGSFGEKGKTIIKKVATAAFPLYKFLVSNSDKLNTRYSYDKIITQLLGLDAPDFGEISKYLCKGFSESDKVSTHWR